MSTEKKTLIHTAVVNFFFLGGGVCIVVKGERANYIQVCYMRVRVGSSKRVKWLTPGGGGGVLTEGLGEGTHRSWRR